MKGATKVSLKDGNKERTLIYMYGELITYGPTLGDPILRRCSTYIKVRCSKPGGLLQKGGKPETRKGLRGDLMN